MKHEKIIKDERGKIRIEIDLVTFRFGQTDKNGQYFRYDTLVAIVPPKKRKECYVSDAATQEEIFTAKMELWQLIKPI